MVCDRHGVWPGACFFDEFFMSIRPLQLLCLLLIFSPLGLLWLSSVKSEPTVIHFWNGNKTPGRQVYEREVLDAALEATRKGYGNVPVVEDRRDLPVVAEESAAFREGGADVFGTVAGNPKLARERKLLVPLPLMKGLLGQRILIIRAADQEKFEAVRTLEDLRAFTNGVPDGWAETELFRANQLPVDAENRLETLFDRLVEGAFDYVTFGANEIEQIMSDQVIGRYPQLMREDTLLIYYPFPVVFYVTPDNPVLAQRLSQGMANITRHGGLDAIFERHFGDLRQRLRLDERHIITLENPLLPPELADFQQPSH